MERKVMERLWRHGSLDAKGIAAEFGISERKASVVLSRLGSKGLVVGKSVRTGHRGRPGTAYHAAISKKEFSDKLAEELRSAVLDVDARFGVSKDRVRVFAASLKTIRE